MNKEDIGPPVLVAGLECLGVQVPVGAATHCRSEAGTETNDEQVEGGQSHYTFQEELYCLHK